MDAEHWDSSLAEMFRKMRSPTRPNHSEVEQMRHWAAEHLSVLDKEIPRRSHKILQFGVTEELSRIPWPETVELTAADKSEAMIGTFWPGDADGRLLCRADWDDLPLERSSFDIALGDGIFNARTFPDGYSAFSQTVLSFLRVGGVCIVRVFVQLEDRESPDDVVRAIRTGEITDYDVFRFRLLISLQASPFTGVVASTDLLDEAMISRGLSIAELHERTGTPPRQLPTDWKRPPIGHAARISRMSYPTLSDLRNVFALNSEFLGARYGNHAAAMHCPIVAIRRVR